MKKLKGDVFEMRKFLLMIAIVTIVISGFSTTISAINKETRIQEYKRIIKEYNLQIVNSIPNGIRPIKITSPKELANLVSEAESLCAQIEHIRKTTLSDLSDGFHSLHSQNRVSAFGAYFNLSADLFVRNSKIVSANEYVYLSGFTLGVGLSHSYHFHQFLNNDRSIMIKGGGEIDYYTYIPYMNIVVKYYSFNTWLTMYW